MSCSAAGCDLSRTVEEVGSECKIEVQKGDKVFGVCHGGNHVRSSVHSCLWMRCWPSPIQQQFERWCFCKIRHGQRWPLGQDPRGHELGRRCFDGSWRHHHRPSALPRAQTALADSADERTDPHLDQRRKHSIRYIGDTICRAVRLLSSLPLLPWAPLSQNNNILDPVWRSSPQRAKQIYPSSNPTARAPPSTTATRTAAAKSAISRILRCATSSTASRSNPRFGSMPPPFRATPVLKNSTALRYCPLTAGPRSGKTSTCAGYWLIPLSGRRLASLERTGPSSTSIMRWGGGFGRSMRGCWGKGGLDRILWRLRMVGCWWFLMGKEW